MNKPTPDSFPKILHIITRLDPGGSATNTLATAAGMRKRGFESAIAYGRTSDPDNKLPAFFREHGIESFTLPCLVRPIAPGQDWKAWKSIRRLLDTHAFDLIHTHTSKAGVLGRLAAKAKGIPVVHTAHGHIFYGYFGRLLTAVFVWVERALAPGTSRLISLTDRETQEALARGIGRAEQYVTIRSGVPIARFRNLQKDPAFRTKHAIAPDDILFIAVGRLTGVKGFDLLLKAFARAQFQHPAKLIIVGDGEEKTSLETLIRELQMESRIMLAGALDDPRPALATADALVMSSRNEGMGRVLVEAMAAGLPVLGTDVGGVRTVVEHRQTGLLVPAENIEALAAAMETLNADAGLRKQLGQRAAASVYPAYDEATMLDRLAQVYRQVLRKPEAMT